MATDMGSSSAWGLPNGLPAVNGINSHPPVEEPREFDILGSMQKRRAAVEQEKVELDTRITNLSEKIEVAQRRLPKRRPNCDEEKVEDQLRRLDMKQATSTMSLQAEKAILKEKDQLKSKVKELREYMGQEEDLRALQAARRECEVLRITKLEQLGELAHGIRKLQLAQRLGIDCAAVESITLQIPDERMGQVLGKGRATLSKVEQDCAVVVELSNRGKGHGGTAVVSGSRQGCGAARKRMERISLQVDRKLALEDAQLAAVRANRHAMAARLQEQYDIKLDLPQGASEVQLQGLPDALTQVEEHLRGLDCTSQELTLEEKLLPAIIGTKGTNLRRLEEEHTVLVDLDRESRVMQIKGLRAGVASAMEELRDMVYQNTDRAEALPLKAHQASYILQDKAEALNPIREEFRGVYISVDRSREGDKLTSALRIRGTNAKVDKVLPRLQQLLEDIEAKTITVRVEHSDIMGTLVGKGGANVNKIREECKGVLMDVSWEDRAVRLVGDHAEGLEDARARVQAIIDSNQVRVVDVGRDTVMALRSSRFAETRAKITGKAPEGLGLYMDLNGESTARLKGSSENFDEAERMLLDIKAQNFTAELSVYPDDSALLLSGGEEGPLRQLQSKWGVDAHLLRDKGVVRLRGREQAVQDARDELNKMLFGGNDGSVLLLPIPPDAMGALIGKGGATVRKLGTELEVSIEGLSTRHQVRVRGDPDKVLKAKAAIMVFVSEVKHSCVVKVAPGQKPPKWEALRRIADTYNVTVGSRETMKEGDIKIRGSLQDCREAQALVEELITGRGRLSAPITASQAKKLAAQGSSPFQRIHTSNNVQMSLDAATNTVQIEGKGPNVLKARKELYTMLDFMFHGEFAQVSMPKAALLVLGTPAKLWELKDKHNVEPFVDRQCNCIRIMGPGQGLSEAERAVQAALREWQASEVAVSFEEWMLTAIIGKGGGTIREMAEGTGAAIDVDREDFVCRVTGPEKEGVQECRARLEAKVEELRRSQALLMLPKDSVPQFVGKGGANIMRCREETGASLDLGESGPKGSVLRIRGKEEQIQAAKEQVEAFIAKWVAENAHDEVEVPRRLMGSIIGKEGATVRRLEQESGARVRADKEGGRVEITGTHSAVSAAKAQVLAVLAEAERQEEERTRARRQHMEDQQAQQAQQAEQAQKAQQAQQAPPLTSQSEAGPLTNGTARHNATPPVSPTTRRRAAFMDDGPSKSTRRRERRNERKKAETADSVSSCSPTSKGRPSNAAGASANRPPALPPCSTQASELMMSLLLSPVGPPPEVSPVAQAQPHRVNMDMGTPIASNDMAGAVSPPAGAPASSATVAALTDLLLGGCPNGTATRSTSEASDPAEAEGSYWTASSGLRVRL